MSEFLFRLIRPFWFGRNVGEYIVLFFNVDKLLAQQIPVAFHSAFLLLLLTQWPTYSAISRSTHAAVGVAAIKNFPHVLLVPFQELEVTVAQFALFAVASNQLDGVDQIRT